VAADPIIKLDKVEKSYGSGGARTPVLRGVSFDVRAGEFLALVGQSGSGKSTLLNIIGGLDQADAGKVVVLGHDYGTASERALARLRNAEIGFIFQHFNLLDHLDCLANVSLPAKFAAGGNGDPRERAMECLRRVDLGELARRKPGELSGGQKQRVAIARALFHRPKLLLCDEPTGNLDTRTGREIINFFSQLNGEGVTLIIVTHERRVSDAAKRIIRIQDGRLVEGEDLREWIEQAEDHADAEKSA
jgi:putative ABC transport system ATP-binding protein